VKILFYLVHQEILVKSIMEEIVRSLVEAITEMLTPEQRNALDLTGLSLDALVAPFVSMLGEDEDPNFAALIAAAGVAGVELNEEDLEAAFNEATAMASEMVGADQPPAATPEENLAFNLKSEGVLTGAVTEVLLRSARKNTYRKILGAMLTEGKSFYEAGLVPGAYYAKPLFAKMLAACGTAWGACSCPLDRGSKAVELYQSDAPYHLGYTGTVSFSEPADHEVPAPGEQVYAVGFAGKNEWCPWRWIRPVWWAFELMRKKGKLTKEEAASFTVEMESVVEDAPSRSWESSSFPRAFRYACWKAEQYWESAMDELDMKKYSSLSFDDATATFLDCEFSKGLMADIYRDAAAIRAGEYGEFEKGSSYSQYIIPTFVQIMNGCYDGCGYAWGIVPSPAQVARVCGDGAGIFGRLLMCAARFHISYDIRPTSDTLSFVHAYAFMGKHRIGMAIKTDEPSYAKSITEHLAPTIKISTNGSVGIGHFVWGGKELVPYGNKYHEHSYYPEATFPV